MSETVFSILMHNTVPAFDINCYVRVSKLEFVHPYDIVIVSSSR